MNEAEVKKLAADILEEERKLDRFDGKLPDYANKDAIKAIGSLVRKSVERLKRDQTGTAR